MPLLNASNGGVPGLEVSRDISLRGGRGAPRGAYAVSPMPGTALVRPKAAPVLASRRVSSIEALFVRNGSHIGSVGVMGRC